jgi:diphosphomevalonate decarboxylase
VEGITRRQRAARSLLPVSWAPVLEEATGSAPVNIALAKYWGKRDGDLHLPVTDSFSVALDLQTTTIVRQASGCDEVMLNSAFVPADSPFFIRLTKFLDLFRPSPSFAFSIKTENSVPTAAGLASSASGFAALVLALNSFFGWDLDRQKLSCLARLGSGSACRSLYSGFVQWNKGTDPDGRDSFAVPFHDWWPDLRLAILMLSSKEKPVSSREAMRISVETSPVYALWPQQVLNDTNDIVAGIKKHDFSLFGTAAERNALMMHSTMLTASPPICYWLEETVRSMHTVWNARKSGIEVYFTMDAGPNIKLLFLKEHQEAVQGMFGQSAAVDLLPPRLSDS